MTPERKEQEQDCLSFEEVILKAKETMLRDRELLPTMIIEGSNDLIVGKIPDMPATHGERMELMYFLGEAAAKSGRVDQLQQVFLLSEGWMSMASENKQAELRPSQDPDRREVLIISSFQVRRRQKQLKLFEILRSSNEQVVSLREIFPDEDKKDETVEIPLLEAFVRGFQLAFRTKFN